MVMTPLYLVHGWGFDASFWDPLRAEMPDVEFVVADLGFRADRRLPPPPPGAIAVGHSLGALWLLRHRFPWRAFVSINGFTRFSRTPGFLHGWPGKVLERMTAVLYDNPEQVHADFIRRCGLCRPPDGILNVEPLADGLRWLKDWDERPALPRDVPLLALAGRLDAVVSPEMSLDCFPERDLRWCEDGGHLLPISHAPWCAERLRELMSRLP
jgi:pimeloyl-[acyl-carrier protein] methyl ester esterase